jgi:hypothetical protein
LIIVLYWTAWLGVESITLDGGPDNCRLPMVALAVFVQGEYSLRRQDMARYRRVPTRI